MSNLMLYVPTRGRVHNQMTIANLPLQWAVRTVVVCDKGETQPLMKEYRRQGIEVCSIVAPSVANIAEKRAWILRDAAKQGYEHILMLDDDLRFHVRKKTDVGMQGFGNPVNGLDWLATLRADPDLGRLEQAAQVNPRKFERMFDRMNWMLGKYAHGAIGPRFMNHTFGGEFKLNCRYTENMGFNVPIAMEHLELNRTKCAEDWDYTLQLMKAGYANAVYMWGAVSSPLGRYAPGGITGQRSKKQSAEAMRLLARRFRDGEVTVAPDPSLRMGYKLQVHWRKTAKMYDCGSIKEREQRR